MVIHKRMTENGQGIPSSPEPLSPAAATEHIRRIAQADDFTLTLSDHAKDRMDERSITSLDIMYVLKSGFIYDEPEDATRLGYFKYKMLNRTPNSNGREVEIVVIPSMHGPKAKVATVMWGDEPTVRGN